MTIDEAIEKLNKLSLPIKTQYDHANHEAVRLGIEAMKQWKIYRSGGVPSQEYLLPGETAE